MTKNQENGEPICRPIISRVISLNAEHNELLYAIPGGLIGVGLTIDPFLTKGDRLVGNVMGHPGSLPNTFIELEIKYHLLMRLVGVKSSGEGDRVSEIEKGESLMVNVGSTSTGCDVLDTSSKNVNS
jgi:translation initiation factor 2 subunit 3